jgi:DedD protein
MDQELKQRLIGAAVVTALAAIFIPMLFDDPVDTSGQAVSEMTIPEPPVNAPNGPESKLPAGAASVENAAGSITPPIAPATQPPVTEASSAAGIEKIEPGLQETLPADYQPPAEMDANADSGNVPEENVPEEEAEVAQPEPQPAIEDVAPPAPAASAPAKIIPPKTHTPEPEQAVSLPEPPPAIKPAPAKPAEIAAKPAPKNTTKFERWSIQAGSFTKKGNAISQRDKLRKLGFPATLETLSSGKGPIYRLKIGPELSKQRAIEIRNRLNQQNIKTIILAE